MTWRSSGVMAPSVFSSSETTPFLPSAATRSASSAASSAARGDARGEVASRARRGRVVGLVGHGSRPQTVRRSDRKPAVARSARCDRQAQASGALRLLDQRLERSRLADGELGQDLAVDLDPGLAEAVDKSAIGQAVLAHGGVDALDPQGAEERLRFLRSR